MTNTTGIDIEDAIRVHGDWKTRLLLAANGGTEVLDHSRISQDCHCKLGKWLHGDGKELHGKLQSHQLCIETHAAFHLEAGKVAEKINARKFEDAKAMLERQTPYGDASLKVVMAIGKLKKEADLWFQYNTHTKTYTYQYSFLPRPVRGFFMEK